MKTNRTNQISRQRRSAIKDTTGRIETRITASAVIGIVSGVLLSIALTF